MKIDVIKQNGEKVEQITLNKNVFSVEPNSEVVHHAVKLANANIRQASAKTKDRSEVRGGGKKPWRQKGTGRARHGSSRSPIWRGGGITFGPTGNQNYKIKQNKKEARLALKSALTLKAKDKSIRVIDTIQFEQPKTKEFIKFMSELKVEGKTLFVVTKDTINYEALVSASNLKNVAILLLEVNESVVNLGINVYDVLNAKNVVFSKEALNKVEEVLTNG